MPGFDYDDVLARLEQVWDGDFEGADFRSPYRERWAMKARQEIAFLLQHFTVFPCLSYDSGWVCIPPIDGVFDASEKEEAMERAEKSSKIIAKCDSSDEATPLAIDYGSVSLLPQSKNGVSFSDYSAFAAGYVQEFVFSLDWEQIIYVNDAEAFLVCDNEVFGPANSVTFFHQMLRLGAYAPGKIRAVQLTNTQAAALAQIPTNVPDFRGKQLLDLMMRHNLLWESRKPEGSHPGAYLPLTFCGADKVDFSFQC